MPNLLKLVLALAVSIQMVCLRAVAAADAEPTLEPPQSRDTAREPAPIREVKSVGGTRSAEQRDERRAG